MTIASLAIVTTSRHLNVVMEVSTPKAVVLFYLEHLNLGEDERIISATCATLDDDYQFDDEVEKLMYHAIPELYIPEYKWVAARNE